MRRYLILILLGCFCSTVLLALPHERTKIGAQVFIEPGQSHERIEKWFELLEKSGMNVCRIRLFEGHMKRSDGTYDFSLYDSAFNSAAAHGVKIFATLFPDEASGALGGSKFPESKEQLKRISAYIQQVVSHFKDHPAMDSWVLQNEPGGGMIWSDLAKEKQAEWYANKRTDYDNGYVKASLDKELFIRDYTTWFLQWIAGEVRKYDQKGETHLNNHLLFDNLWQYNFPEWMPFLSHLGASIHPSWHLGMFKQEDYTMAIGANCDIIRGGAGNKPFWVTELQGGNNTFSGFYPLCPTTNQIEQWLWTSIATGADGVIFWTLNARATGGEAGEWAMLTMQDEPSERLIKSSEVIQCIEHEKNFFDEANPMGSDITLLYNPESMISLDLLTFESEGPKYDGRKSNAHIKELVEMYRTFLENGIPVQIKPLNGFDWTAKRHSKAIVLLPNMLSIPSIYWDKLSKFVEQGNKAILTGLSGYFDENMHAVFQTSEPLKAMLGASVAEYKVVSENFELKLDEPNLSLPSHLWRGELKNYSAKTIGQVDNYVTATRNIYGKGESVFIPSCIGLGAFAKGNTQLADWLLHETKSVVESLPVYLSGHKPGILLRTMVNGGRYATVLMNTTNTKEKIAMNGLKGKKGRLVYGSCPNTWKGEPQLELAASETLVILWE